MPKRNSSHDASSQKMPPPLIQSGLLLAGFAIGALSVITIEAYIRITSAPSQSSVTLTDKKSCQQQGGQYDEGSKQCVLVTSDRGTTCHSNNDCSGWCIPEREVDIGTETNGICSDTFALQGCFKFVDHGKVNSICMPE